MNICRLSSRHDSLLLARAFGVAKGPVHGTRRLLADRGAIPPITRPCRREITTSRSLRREKSGSRSDDGDADPRFRQALGREISDDYATVRTNYATPRYPIVLAHGLLGFSELQISPGLPNIQYWHGIRQALSTAGATVIAPAVPPSSAIEDRAAKLGSNIADQADRLLSRDGRDNVSSSSGTSDRGTTISDAIHRDADGRVPVNIIAHSMGGLDARYMISHLLPPSVRVASLVTVATPHRGSAFADYVLEEGAGPLYLPRLYGLLERAGFGTGAFAQLTRRYMADEFNPRTPDDPSVRYFSFGAAVDEPSVLSPFRLPHRVIAEAEGANDGLVSVESSRWGDYRGTLLGVSHLDLINWSNRVRWTVREWMGWERKFNAVALYLDIMDMLAKEKL